MSTRATPPSTRTRGSTGITLRRARLAPARRRPSRTRASCSRCLIVGKTSSSSSRAPRVERVLRRDPARVDDLVVVDPHLRARGRARDEEPGVEADLDLRRGDPARERRRARPGRRARGPPPPRSRASPRDRRAGVDSSSVVHGAAGEDPRAAHEASPPGCAAAAAPRARRSASRSRIADAAGRASATGPSFSSSPGPGRSTSTGAPYPPWVISRPVSETTTAQQWICESCGFIYDPEEGDPDGGVPGRHGVRGHPRRLGLPGLRRAQEGLRPLRGLVAARRTGSAELASRRRG